jgi:tRNA A22 N-methylase
MQANKASLVLEWIQEESSEIDEFILVESRKRKKKIGRMLKSLSFKGKKLVQEIHGLPKSRGRKPMAKSSKTVKSKNK